MAHVQKTNIVIAYATDPRRRLRDTVHLHPGQPLMYFTPYVPQMRPEIDFNSIKYYESQQHLIEDNPVDPNIIRDELVMNDVHRFAANKVSCLMKLPNGEIKPAYMSLLSDIHGYLQHKGVSVFIKWFYRLKNDQFEDNEVVPKDIVPLFDLVPTFDSEKAFTYSYPIRERHIFIGATTNTIHVTKIVTQLSVLHISIFTGVTKRKGVNYHRVSLSGKLPTEGKIEVFHEGSYVLIWNAKNLLRPSFIDHFWMLHSCYEPIAFIITEARPKYLQIWDLIKHLPGSYQYSSSGHGAVGGVVVLWTKAAQPHFTTRSSCLTGQVMRVEVVPGVNPPPPVWDGLQVIDLDDDYDYVRAWRSGSGLDTDPSIHDEGWH